jgi:MFS family permease
VLATPPFLLAVASTLSVFVGLYVLIPALPPYAATFGATKSQIGLVVGIYSIAATAARLLTGRLLDRLGRKPFVIAGFLLFAAAAASYGLARSLPALLLLRVLHGVGWGWALTAMGTLVADLAPPARRGEAVGYWGLAPTLAMSFGPLLGSALLKRGGNQAAFAAAALLALGAAALAAPIREPPHESGAEERARAGVPHGALLPSATVFLSSLSYGAILAFLPVELAASPGRSGLFFTLYALTILVARPLAGRLSDRAGRPAVIHPGLAIGALGTALLGGVQDVRVLAAAAVLYGAGIAGAVFPGLMALTVDRAPVALRGAALAVFFSAYDLSIAGGAVLLGPLYDRFGFAAMALAAAGAVVVSHVGFALGLRREP